MNNMEFKPNSHKSKEETQNKSTDKRVEKVVRGSVKTKKKNELRKFTGAFISEEAGNIGSYIMMDVLIPTIKKTLVDIVTDGFNMLFFGDAGRHGRSGSSTSKVSYRNYYDRKEPDRFAPSSPRARTRFDYDDIVFENRGEADNVLDEMGNIIERYGFVTVADMYDMADLTHPFTCTKYGWSSLSGAEIVRLREGGYIIKLPPAQPID